MFKDKMCTLKLMKYAIKGLMVVAVCLSLFLFCMIFHSQGIYAITNGTLGPVIGPFMFITTVLSVMIFVFYALAYETSLLFFTEQKILSVKKFSVHSIKYSEFSSVFWGKNNKLLLEDNTGTIESFNLSKWPSKEVEQILSLFRKYNKEIKTNDATLRHMCDVFEADTRRPQETVARRRTVSSADIISEQAVNNNGESSSQNGGRRLEL